MQWAASKAGGYDNLRVKENPSGISIPSHEDECRAHTLKHDKKKKENFEKHWVTERAMVLGHPM